MKNNSISKTFSFSKYICLKKITNNLGRVEELDDKIICYVDNRKLKRTLINNSCRLFFKGTSNLDEMQKNAYQINKPIYYIIDGMDFDVDVAMSSEINTCVLFKNCIFKCSIGIREMDEVIFENNKYYNDNEEYIIGECFFCGRKINTFRLINDNFININKDKAVTFTMDLEALNLEIVNSNIETNYGHVTLSAPYLELRNTMIYSPRFYIRTNEFVQNRSTIVSDEWEIDCYRGCLKNEREFQKKLNRNN